MINVLKQAALEAGTILLNYYKKNLILNYKTSHKDFYTIADVESQKIIKETLVRLLAKKGIKESEIGFIGEEKLSVGNNKKHLFVIDPLDGTTNFASGFDFFAVSIAYFYSGVLTAGLVYQPTNKNIYYAIKGKGAYKNNQPLKIIYKLLKNCLLDGLISSKTDISSNLFNIYKKIFSRILGYRNLSYITLDNCLLAENVFNIVTNGHTFIWDIAAVKLIVEEAGGIMVDFKGQSVSFNLNNPKQAYDIISCHPKLKKEILPFFSN